MTIERAVTPDVPDHTASSQAGGKGSMGDASRADLRRGYTKVESEQVSPYNANETGTYADTMTGDQFSAGGFLGRQRGFSR